MFALVREQDTVDDVDVAVGALHGLDDLGVGVGRAHEGLRRVDRHQHARLLGGAVLVHAQGVVRAAVAGRALLVGGHVVLEDVRQLGDVLQSHR